MKKHEEIEVLKIGLHSLQKKLIMAEKALKNMDNHGEINIIDENGDSIRIKNNRGQLNIVSGNGVIQSNYFNEGRKRSRPELQKTINKYKRLIACAKKVIVQKHTELEDEDQ